MFENDLSVRVENTEPVWSALDEWPEIERWIGPDTTRTLRAGIPALRDVNGVDQPPYFRPNGHRRAFYVRFEHGVIAIKGSEPYAANFTEMLDDLRKSRVLVELRLGSPSVDRTLTRAEMSGIDKLAVVEGKLPGCMTVREAVGEARAAFAVQRAYVEKFGAPARMPLPIYVGKWPQDRVEVVRAALRERMRDRALHIAEAALDDGIGVYAYHYPSIPLRLAHLSVPDAKKGKHIAKRLETIKPHFDPRAAVEGWFGLTAQLLAIGFCAKDPASLVTGDCLQVQNVCLDGGFTDVESLIPTSALDERALREGIRRTVHELALDATRMLFGLWASTVDMRDRVPELFAIVWADLAARVEAIGASDARVLDILRARPDALSAIMRTLELAY